MSVSMEIRELGEFRLRGGILVDCTESADFRRSELGSSLVSHLGLEVMAYVESDSFPSMSRVISYVPHPPMRICSSLSSKIAVIQSDFVPSEVVEKVLGRSLLSWAKSKNVAMIVTTVIADESFENDIGAISSTASARRRIEDSKIDIVETLNVRGLSAVLLNEGRWANFDVIALVVKKPDDAASFSTESLEERIIQGIDVILPEIRMNLEDSFTKDERETLADKRSVSPR